MHLIIQFFIANRKSVLLISFVRSTQWTCRFCVLFRRSLGLLPCSLRGTLSLCRISGRLESDGFSKIPPGHASVTDNTFISYTPFGPLFTYLRSVAQQDTSSYAGLTGTGGNQRPTSHFTVNGISLITSR